jgi:hypothetical protein
MVDAGEARGFFLRDAPGLAQFPNPGADGLEFFRAVHGRIIPSQSLRASRPFDTPVALT